MTGKGLIAPLFFGLFLLVENANALPITLNANDYSPGTDITHAISGVQLQDYSHTAYADTLTLTDAITPTDNIDFCPPGESCITSSLSSSINDYDYNSILNPNNNYPMNTSQINFTGLYLSSSKVFSVLNFNGVSGSGASYYVFLFDKHGNFIQSNELYGQRISSCIPENGSLIPCTTYSGNYDLSGLPVYNIAIGSTDLSYLTTLTVGVAEPGSLALLGIGLLGLGITWRRKAGVKRQSRFSCS